MMANMPIAWVYDKWQVIKNGVIVLDTYFNLLRLLFESGGGARLLLALPPYGSL